VNGYVVGGYATTVVVLAAYALRLVLRARGTR
jgi:hypothetical protein